MLPYNKDNKENARSLRKAMTSEERHLWYDFLRKLPVDVKRQKSIGRYIVDFYVPSAKVVIEIDGAQHYEPENKEKDNIRDKKLNELGLTVLRYTNFDIKKRFRDVISDILNHVGLTYEDMNFEK